MLGVEGSKLFERKRKKQNVKMFYLRWLLMQGCQIMRLRHF